MMNAMTPLREPALVRRPLTRPSATLSRRERAILLPLPPGEGWGEGLGLRGKLPLVRDYDDGPAHSPRPSPGLRPPSPGGSGVSMRRPTSPLALVFLLR